MLCCMSLLVIFALKPVIRGHLFCWKLQLRKREVCESSFEEIRNFEFSCLGEVRILGALKHSCIVQMYGHQISSEWIPSENGKPKRRLLRSAIFLEHVKGGSLKVNCLLTC